MGRLLPLVRSKKWIAAWRNLQQRSLQLAAFCLLLLAISAAQAAEATFVVKGYHVDGLAYFSDQQLARIFAPYIGEGQSFDSLRAAQQALTAAYATAGFGMVKASLPPQESKDGYITIKVKPVLVQNISLQGETYDDEFHDEFNILNAMPGLRSGQPLNPGFLARQLRLSNENPSKQVSVTLTPTEDDQIDAEVIISNKRPWKAFATYDNTGYDDTGEQQTPSRVSVGFQHANLFNRDHVLTAQYITSPNDYAAVRIWGLGYQIPIYAWAHDINFYASHSDVDSGTISNLLEVRSKGYVYGARYQLNFANRGLYKDKLAFGLEYHIVQPDVSVFGIQLSQPVDLRPFTLSYTGNYTDPGKLDANFYLAAVKNIPGGPDGNDEDFNVNRFGASADYNILRLGGSLTKVLPDDWYARFSAHGQYTEDLLVSAEQFGVGGMDSVRGFPEYAVRNDKGLQAMAELYSQDFFASRQDSNISARALVFYDVGKVWRNDPLPGELPSETIASVGLGLRVGLGQTASLKLDYAKVLDGTAITQSGFEHLHVLLVLLY